jgi:hypothetical protein
VRSPKAPKPALRSHQRERLKFANGAAVFRIASRAVDAATAAVRIDARTVAKPTVVNKNRASAHQANAHPMPRLVPKAATIANVS